MFFQVMQRMIISEHYYQGFDGTRLFYRKATANKKPSKAVLVVHGWAEHSGRYRDVINTIVKTGAAVYAPDLRGHGMSEGQRGHVNLWSDYLQDLMVLVRKIEVEQKDLPVVVLGHSMGGLISIRLIEEYQNHFKGLFVSGALLKLALPVPRIKTMVGELMSNIVPFLSLPNDDVTTEHLTSDPDKQCAHRNDPLIHNQVSTRWYTEMTKAAQKAMSEAAIIKIPVMVIHGGNDPLNALEGSQQFYENLKVENKTLKIYPGMLHEPFNEKNNAGVYTDLEDWFSSKF